MTELRQRRFGTLDFAKGGWAHYYHLLDGAKTIGSKTVFSATRNGPVTTTYFLGDDKFATARELIAAYEAQKSKAA